MILLVAEDNVQLNFVSPKKLMIALIYSYLELSLMVCIGN